MTNGISKLLETRDELVSIVGEIEKSEPIDEVQLQEFKDEHVKNISGVYTKEQLEMSIDEDKRLINELKSQVEDFEALSRLVENDDFVRFMNAYFVKEPKRITGMLTHSHAIDNNTEDQLMKKLSGIRHFKLFIKALRSIGEDALNEIEGKTMNIEVIETVISENKFKVEKKGDK